MSAEGPQLMRISEVRTLLAISKSTYYQLRYGGQLGPVLTVGVRGVRHRKTDVEAYVESLVTDC
jgi:predicted DNA-binding transcriptional regulator AlpA